jgi:hypothetical protein
LHALANGYTELMRHLSEFPLQLGLWLLSRTGRNFHQKLGFLFLPLSLLTS